LLKLYVISFFHFLYTQADVILHVNLKNQNCSCMVVYWITF